MENLPALQQKAVSLRDYLNRDQIKNTLNDALPKTLSVERLLRIVFTSTMRNPKLLDCTKESILQSIMLCGQLGIEPILGRGYLIPYNNSVYQNGKWVKQLECQFQPGYQGLVDIARRSGKVDDVFAEVVYEKDEFEIRYGTERRLHHKPYIGESDPGKVLGAYAVWYLSSGIKPFEFMPLHKIYKRRDRSQAYQYAQKNPNNAKAQDIPWITWEDEMCRKTVIKHSSKLMPASIEFLDAVVLDNAAEIGTTQMGLLKDDITLLPTPGAKPPEDKPKTFDELAKMQDEYKGNEKFLETLVLDNSQKTKETVEQFKTRATEDFPNFWKYFVGCLEQAKKDPKNWNENQWREWVATWKNKKSSFVGFSLNPRFLDTLRDAPQWVQSEHRYKWENKTMEKHVLDARWPLFDQAEEPPPPEEIKEQKEQKEPIHARIKNSFTVKQLTTVLSAMSINFPHDEKRPEIIYEFLASGVIDPTIMAIIEKKCAALPPEDEELTDAEKQDIIKQDLINDITDRFLGAVLNQAMDQLEYGKLKLEDATLDQLKKIVGECEQIKPF